MSVQKKIGSGFDAASTGAQIMDGVDLSGKTAIITGGYSGLGLETARALAGAGARIIVPARDVQRAAKALQGIGAQAQAMDLTDPASVDAFADRFEATNAPLHLLINCAGVMASPLSRDARGNEGQLSTNHLGHFRLTQRLGRALARAGGARVVTYSSRGHQIAPVDFEDPNFESRPYEKWTAYGQSKTANALFAVALDRRGRDEGIRAFSVHPGSILTDLARSLSTEEIAAFNVFDEAGNLRNDPYNDLKNVAQGVATGLWAATSPSLTGLGGLYCEDCDVAEPQRDGVNGGVAAWASDPDLAERLWALSQRLEG